MKRTEIWERVYKARLITESVCSEYPQSSEWSDQERLTPSNKDDNLIDKLEKICFYEGKCVRSWKKYGDMISRPDSDGRMHRRIDHPWYDHTFSYYGSRAKVRIWVAGPNTEQSSVETYTRKVQFEIMPPEAKLPKELSDLLTLNGFEKKRK